MFRSGISGLVFLAYFCLVSVAGAQKLSSAEALIDPGTGRLFALKPVVSAARTSGAVRAPLSKTAVKTISDNFIAANKSLIRLKDPASELKVKNHTVDNGGHSHIGYAQFHLGVPVYPGGEMFVHINPSGEVVYANTSIAENLPLTVKPENTKGKAMDLAAAQAVSESADGLSPLASGVKLVVLPLAMLTDARFSTNAVLAWFVPLRGPQGTLARDYFVNAQPRANGEPMILFRQDQFDGIGGWGIFGTGEINRKVFDCGIAPDDTHCVLDQLTHGTHDYTYGRSEGQPLRGPNPYPDNSWNVTRTDLGPTPVIVPYRGSTDVDNAYDYLSQMRNFLNITFLRNGANGTGNTYRDETAVNAHADRIDSEGWCPSGAWYERDHGVLNFCLGAAHPDVIGHEYTHALSDSLTGGMQNTGQPGAINEAFSDVLGEAFESYLAGASSPVPLMDWKMGTGSVWGWSRNLQSPWNMAYGYDSTTGKYLLFPDRSFSPRVYCGSADSFGAHYNSTIVSHAFYVMAMGDKRNCDVEAIGVFPAISIFYNAFASNYILTTDGFRFAYSGFQQSCNALYGANSTVCANATKAMQSAQLDSAQGLYSLFACPGGSGAADPGITCAVRNVTNISTARPDGRLTSVYVPGEHIAVKGNGIPGRSVNFRVKNHKASRPDNYDILTSPLEGSTVVGADGTFLAVLVPDPSTFTLPVGNYDLIMDGNGDFTWETWADLVIPFQVISPPPNNDGLCYAGETYASSENCNSSPVDCACPYDYNCKNDGAGRWSCYFGGWAVDPELPRPEIERGGPT